MIDPSKLERGQRIELKQNDRGEWQEWVFDINNNIVDVETFKPFEESKKIKSNNYAELKKNYVYLSEVDKKPNDPWKLELPEIDVDNDPLEIDPPDDDRPDEHIIDCGESREDGDPNLEEEEINEDKENHDNEEEH